MCDLLTCVAHQAWPVSLSRAVQAEYSVPAYRKGKMQGLACVPTVLQDSEDK